MYRRVILCCGLSETFEFCSNHVQRKKLGLSSRDLRFLTVQKSVLKTHTTSEPRDHGTLMVRHGTSRDCGYGCDLGRCLYYLLLYYDLLLLLLCMCRCVFVCLCVCVREGWCVCQVGDSGSALTTPLSLLCFCTRWRASSSKKSESVDLILIASWSPCSALSALLARLRALLVSCDGVRTK